MNSLSKHRKLSFLISNAFCHLVPDPWSMKIKKTIKFRKLKKIIKQKNKTEFLKAISQKTKHKQDKDIDQYLSFFIPITIALLVSGFAGLSPNTVLVTFNLSEILFHINLTILGVVFSAYAIFFALIAYNSIKIMHDNKRKDDQSISFLEDIITYVGAICFLYFFALIICATILILSKCLPLDYCLFSSYFANEIIAFVLLFVCFGFVFRVLFEFINVIYTFFLLIRFITDLRLQEIELADCQKQSKHQHNIRKLYRCIKRFNKKR